jgi:hypothetical protein
MSDDTFPEAVDSLFTGRTEEDIQSTETPKENLQAAETPATAARPEPNDLDKVIRQRDAIIREKQELARERSELLRRLDEQKQAVQPPAEQKPKPTPPDPRKDPVGFLEFQRKSDQEKLEQEIEKVKQEYTERFEAMERERAIRTTLSRVLHEEEQFRQRQPDYDDAMAHFEKQSLHHLQVNVGLPQEEAAQRLEDFKRDLFLQCNQLGIPIAEAFYYHALQAGWQAPKPVQQAAAAPLRESPPAVTSLSAVGSSGSSASPDGGKRISMEEFSRLPAGHPLRLQISGNGRLFRQLVEHGEVALA